MRHHHDAALAVEGDAYRLRGVIDGTESEEHSFDERSSKYR